jgi:hypothetical protein
MVANMFAHLVTDFPETVTLVEKYHAPGFLKIVAEQSSESTLDVNIVRHAQKILDVCRKSDGRNNSTIVYKQPEFSVQNRKVRVSRFEPRNRYECYQNMKGELRELVVDGQYMELDQNMANQRIVASLYSDAILVDFVHRADEIYEEIAATCGVELAAVKDLINPILTGSSIDGKGGWMDRNGVVRPPPDSVYKIVAAFKDNLARARTEDDFKDLMVIGARQAKAKGKFGPENTQNFYIMSTIEAKITLTAAEFLTERGIEAASLRHDGLYIPSGAEVICEDVTTYVREKLGLPYVMFKLKPVVPNMKSDFIERAMSTHIEAPTLGTLSDYADLLYKRCSEDIDALKIDGMSGKNFVFRDGVWSEVSTGNIEKLFISFGKRCAEEMGCKSAIFWNNFKTIINFVVKEHCLDDGFSNKLDASLTIFPFANGCWDFSIRAFRELRKEDYVRKTSGYNYEPGQDRSVILKFLNEVFPWADEREAFSVFAGYVLNPLKKRKKMAVLTDATDGWNAKTESMKMLISICGELAVKGESAKKLMIKDTSNNKNGHDACLEKLNGMFVIAADELSSNIQLATHTLKELTSFPRITGRHFGSSSTFDFQCKAVPLFSFNKGQMPMMGQDAVFYERMLFFHFRAKFIPAETEEEFLAKATDYEYPYRVDPNMEDKLMRCRSAAFDHFVECAHDKLHVLDNPPPSLIEFRKELTQDDNPMTEFFDAHFEITRDPTDSVQVNEINVYISKVNDKATRNLPGSIRFRKNCFETYLKTHGIRVHNRARVDGEQKRNVAFGVRFTAEFLSQPEDYECEITPPRASFLKFIN